MRLERRQVSLAGDKSTIGLDVVVHTFMLKSRGPWRNKQIQLTLLGHKAGMYFKRFSTSVYSAVRPKGLARAAT